jgi:hypothetical protein
MVRRQGMLLFEDIPEGLTAAVRDARADFPDEKIYMMAASLVIIQYVRKMIDDPEKPHEFLGNKKDDNGGSSWRHTVRMQIIGESLFQLRKCSGFAEICKRLRDIDLRAACYEMFAARLVHDAGFEISVKKPDTYIKGQDFDFSATKNGETINAEVTALTAPNFSSETVWNALHHKAGQLPKTEPALIFCAYPEGWHDPKVAPSDVFREPTNKFFRSSRRVNAVVLLNEVHKPVGDGNYGGLFIGKETIFNESPRLPISLDFLLQDPPMNEVTCATFEKADDLKRLVSARPPSEFRRWVDLTVSGI